MLYYNIINVCCYYNDVFSIQHGMTALHYACSNGCTEVVNYLIYNAPNISAPDSVSD